MFGRRFTRSGWIKLRGLAFVVALILFIILAPLSSFTIRVSLPSASATPKPVTQAEWLGMLGGELIFLLVLALLVGLVTTSVLLVVRTAQKIIREQPRSDE